LEDRGRFHRVSGVPQPSISYPSPAGRINASI